MTKLVIRYKGGKGSGNFGHVGRPGKQGGSGGRNEGPSKADAFRKRPASSARQFDDKPKSKGPQSRADVFRTTNEALNDIEDIDVGDVTFHRTSKPGAKNISLEHDMGNGNHLVVQWNGSDSPSDRHIEVLVSNRNTYKTARSSTIFGKDEWDKALAHADSVKNELLKRVNATPKKTRRTGGRQAGRDYSIYD